MFRSSINLIRFLIFGLIFVSCFFMVLSTKALPHLSKLSINAECTIHNGSWIAFWDSKTYAEADIYYTHPPPGIGSKLIGQHWHTLSYSLYTRVADDEKWKPEKLPDGNIPYGNISIGSLKIIFPAKRINLTSSGYPRSDNGAEASASVSETQTKNWDPTNWDFCPKPQ